MVRTTTDLGLPPLEAGTELTVTLVINMRKYTLKLKVIRVEITEVYVRIYTELGNIGSARFRDIHYDFTEADKGRRKVTPQWITDECKEVPCESITVE